MRHTCVLIVAIGTRGLTKYDHDKDALYSYLFIQTFSWLILFCWCLCENPLHEHEAVA